VYDSPDMEQSAAKQMVNRQHTVNEMIEYHRRGATIILQNPNDSVRIYEWLRDHLQAIRGKTQFSMEIGSLPMEDLVAMDDFASVVYRIARQYELVDVRKGGIDSKLDDMMFRNRRLSRRKAKEDNTHQNEQEQAKPIKEHESIADDISRTALQRGLRFK